MVQFKGDTAAVIGAFIGIIIAIVFLASIATSIVGQTNTITTINETVTAPAVNASLALTGRDYVGSGVVHNATNGTLIPTVNFTFSDGLVNGAKTVLITTLDGASGYAGESINVSYEYGAEGYLADSGSRSIALLIIIFGALAAVIFTLVMFWKSESGKFLRGK